MPVFAKEGGGFNLFVCIRQGLLFAEDQLPGNLSHRAAQLKCATRTLMERGPVPNPDLSDSRCHILRRSLEKERRIQGSLRCWLIVKIAFSSKH